MGSRQPAGPLVLYDAGMWLGISEDWWMQIWSGVIGAGVAAGVSIVVAFLVVAKTNAHQSILAETARKLQRERDDKALEIQRDGMQKQLNEQRQEADRLRMMDIRADVISAAAHMVEVANVDLKAIEAAAPHLGKALTRWRVETEDEALVEELSNWPALIRILAMEHALALRDSDPAASVASFDNLNDAVSLLTVVALHLRRDDYVPAKSVTGILRKGRLDIETSRSGRESSVVGQ
jgi:predicted MarR family transcription regulator